MPNNEKKEEIIPEIQLPDFPTQDIEMKSQPFIERITGKVRTVAAIPTWKPRNLYEQQAIFISGVTYRFYIYDETNAAWRYSTLT